MSIVPPPEDLETVIRTLNRRVVEIQSQLKILSQSPSQKLSKKYLSSDEVCKVLRISERTLSKMRAENSIPYCKNRRKIAYRAEDVYEFLEQRFR